MSKIDIAIAVVLFVWASIMVSGISWHVRNARRLRRRRRAGARANG